MNSKVFLEFLSDWLVGWLVAVLFCFVLVVVVILNHIALFEILPSWAFAYISWFPMACVSLLFLCCLFGFILGFSIAVCFLKREGKKAWS